MTLTHSLYLSFYLSLSLFLFVCVYYFDKNAKMR